MTEKPPNPKIADITGSETLLVQSLQPFETSRTELIKSEIFSLITRLFKISERHEKVSTHAEIFIIALAPEATELINTFSLFSGVIVLFVLSVFLSLKNLQRNPKVSDVRIVDK